MKNEENLSKTISFRVTEEIWSKARERGALEKLSVNEWSRSLTEQATGREFGLTPASQILLAEIYSLRKLVETVFDLISTGKLDEQAFLDVMLDNGGERQAVLKNYFTKTSILTAGENNSVM